MAKRPRTVKDAEDALGRLLSERARLESLQPKLALELQALDPLVGDALQRRSNLISEQSAVAFALEALEPAIASAQGALRDLREADRESEVIRLRSQDAAAFSQIVAATTVLHSAIEGWIEVTRKLQALNTGSFSPRIGPLIVGVQTALQTWRAVVPELVGLPAKLTRDEELRADAVLQVETRIAQWVAADAGAHDESTNAVLRSKYSKRAEDLLAAVDRDQARCRQVGAEPPSGPLSLMGQLLNFLDKQAKALGRARLDREEDRLLAQSTPDTPGSMAILADRKDRRRP